MTPDPVVFVMWFEHAGVRVGILELETRVEDSLDSHSLEV